MQPDRHVLCHNSQNLSTTQAPETGHTRLGWSQGNVCKLKVTAISEMYILITKVYIYTVLMLITGVVCQCTYTTAVF